MSFSALLDLLGARLAPLTKAPAEGAPADAVQVLTDVYERIGAMLTRVQESNGLLPEGMAAEVSAAAGMLLSLAPGGAAPPAATPAGTPAAAPGTTYLAQPGTVPVVLSQQTKRALAARLSKVELDAYTARVATLNAANDRWWKMRNLFEQGKDAEGNAELKGIAEMLTQAVSTSEGGAAAPLASEKRECSFTPASFTLYAMEQVQKAAHEEKAAASKRLTHLAHLSRLLKAWYFEQQGNEGMPFAVSIETAYAPEGDGKVMDLTTRADQSERKGDLLGGNPGAQTSMFKAETLAKIDHALADLLAELGAPPSSGDKTSETGETSIAKGAPAEAEADGFLWPGDLAASVREEEEALAAKKRGGVHKRDDSLSFGKDPWAR